MEPMPLIGLRHSDEDIRALFRHLNNAWRTCRELPLPIRLAAEQEVAAARRELRVLRLWDRILQVLDFRNAQLHFGEDDDDV